MRGQAKTVIAKMKADHKAALEKAGGGSAMVPHTPASFSFN